MLVRWAPVQTWPRQRGPLSLSSLAPRLCPSALLLCPLPVRLPRLGDEDCMARMAHGTTPLRPLSEGEDSGPKVSGQHPSHGTMPEGKSATPRLSSPYSPPPAPRSPRCPKPIHLSHCPRHACKHDNMHPLTQLARGEEAELASHRAKTGPCGAMAHSPEPVGNPATRTDNGDVLHGPPARHDISHGGSRSGGSTGRRAGSRKRRTRASPPTSHNSIGDAEAAYG
jgi:hypothetical protein